MSAPAANHSSAIERAAEGILSGFDAFHDGYKGMTRTAAAVFAAREWDAIPALIRARTGHYRNSVDETVERIRPVLGEAINEHITWRSLKVAFAVLIAPRREAPIIETFFNSVLRKLLRTEGIDVDIEFINLTRGVLHTGPPQPIYNRFYLGNDNLEIIWARILRSYNFDFHFKDVDKDAERIASAIRQKLTERFGRQENVDQMDMVRSVFYRNKGAYLVGKITKGNIQIPIVLPLLNKDGGAYVDSVLLTKDEIAVVFSFTRNYFFVETDNPVDLIHFLRPLMSHKNLSELYASIGYDKHSKTVLFREIYQHLERSDDQFIVAPGTKGMVMAVFTLPTFNVVFKVIRDKFGPTKNFGRQHVIDSYRIVCNHDRAGRLADAMEFDHLKLDLHRFSQPVLDELLSECASTVFIEGDKLVVRHAFTERKLVPLNLFLETAPPDKAEAAVIDLGHAIKELAAANLFPGDLLLKNFGVTRHGRVIFYDYDELCFLDAINFRRIPPPRRQEQMMSGEPWYTVAENDVFPEEFDAFMVPEGQRELFLREHGDLFDVAFWKQMQQMHRDGALPDLFPYRRTAIGLSLA